MQYGRWVYGFRRRRKAVLGSRCLTLKGFVNDGMILKHLLDGCRWINLAYCLPRGLSPVNADRTWYEYNRKDI